MVFGSSLAGRNGGPGPTSYHTVCVPGAGRGVAGGRSANVFCAGLHTSTTMYHAPPATSTTARACRSMH
eukprot:7275844-Prymnesium_polylepis.1